jgi:glycosyltransferase involved in cell wall biosynthesis
MKSKYTIGIDARSFGWTGIGRYIRNLTNELFLLDTDNEYVLFMHKDDFASYVVPDQRVRKVRVDIPHYSAQEQISLGRILKKENLDLMHFPHFNVPLLYNDAFLVTIHDLTLSFFPGQKMTSLLHRAAYQLTIHHAAKRAAKIIAVSKNTQKDLENILHIPKTKIRVIYESVENEKYHNHHPVEKLVALKEKYNLNRPFLLYVGVWRSHKNILGMLEAVKKMRDRGLDFQVVITGKTDPHYPEVTEKIQELGLKDIVVLPGFVPEEELPLLFAAARCFVFPSFYEGFGLPPLEAMASGTPVASSNTSAMPEILGDAAAFFDPYDTQQMADVIMNVFQNESTRTQLIQKGLAHVKQFDWKKMAEETLLVYKEALEKK